MKTSIACFIVLFPVVFCASGEDLTAAQTSSSKMVTLKAWGVPTGASWAIADEFSMAIYNAFNEKFPHVKLEPATGLNIPGRSMETVPLMQIAGDISPAVMSVCFRQSSTYIEQKFLYPLDKYLEKASEVDLRDSHLMGTGQYIAALRRSDCYAKRFEERIPPQCWEVIRRECPYGEKCPYVKEWGGKAAARHSHVWCLPQESSVTALFYLKDLFAEAGLPDRVPGTMEEFLEWARAIHNPKENIYGVNIPLSESGWSTLSFFYSFGARAVECDDRGRWRCVFNSPEAVEAYYYVARLFLEPFENKHGRFEGVVNLGEQNDRSIRFAMYFKYLSQQLFQRGDPNAIGFGPVPYGACGMRGSEFNAQMTGIYAGFDKNTDVRDAAWDWMMFFGGNEANLIKTKILVENGLERFAKPGDLEAAGYPELVDQIPAGWSEAAKEVIRNGVPEPYGRNCQMVYHYMSQAIDQIRTDSEVGRSIRAGEGERARRRIKEILDIRVEIANQKMLNLLPEDVRKFRSRVAAFSAFAIFTIFVLLIFKVFKTFSESLVRSDADRARGEWQFGRNKMAYLILIPSLLSIAVWSYWPLMRGTVMAFQDYNVRGFSTWAGFENFGKVLFSREFWYAMLVSLKYTAMAMTIGFVSPILLALLLTEVPRGKIFFRTIYYLPAMLSGVIVIFLWKGFYGQHGMINQVLNWVVLVVNYLCDTHIAEFTTDWLNSPSFALFFCLLPSIWAGMGPGCLIYLAALKGIPEDIYEAADIDGASVFQKVWRITIPSIKALIVINFIGHAIGCMHSGSGYILAMTGGGPYTPYGETEVIGLHIFWEAFGYLRFGVATAMAWVLGAMLIGFTVYNLQKMSKMEFKAAGGK